MGILSGGIAAFVFYALAFVVLYAVVRAAVHHGIRDAEREREKPQK
ncbi:hypothetical protein [Salinispora pacifica]|nr:hypothetical protein [Salinispora pacifica]